MNLTVVHGFAKIPLDFDRPNETLLEELMNQLEQLSGVPLNAQKLIYKVLKNLQVQICYG